MPRTSRLLTAAVGGLMLLGTAAISHAQSVGSPQRVGQVASLAPGSIQGVVTDEKGMPVAGAMVSAIGAVTTFAVADPKGRFELSALTPGPYLVRAHRTGYTGSRGELIDVRPSVRVSSAISLRRLPEAYPVLAAGVGLSSTGEWAVGAGRTEPAVGDDAPADTTQAGDDPSETAWRVRHARRGVLKNAVIPADVLVDAEPRSHPFVPVEILGRAVGSPARIATSFFADTPFSGQLNLLTTTSFDTPEQLFSRTNVPRGIAYARVGAPVGTNGDWTVRGALTQADISAWLIAGSYKTRAPAEHRYEIGMSYSTQRYDGGNPLALRDVADGSRNAGTVYGFDTFTVTPSVTFAYGGRYAQYDYLEHRTLISPRAELTLTPTDEVRITATVSKRAHAPGAEEFLPPGDSGIWLPPQRTFSSLESGRVLEAERTTQVAFEVERDIAAATTIAFRAFRQHVDDQLVTLFGVEMPNQPVAKLGHYLIGNAGDVTAQGGGASFRTMIASRVQGSIAYSLAKAELDPAADLRYLILLAPSAVRPAEHIHDVATTIQADLPETSTRVLVLYRMSNAFARSAASVSERAPDHRGFDSRFDVQVRQLLPFLDSTAAKWEMLVAVRNFFRETSPDQSVYDELLSIRPPKRIVGGVTVHF